MDEVRLTVNGAPVVARVPANLTLLRFLRDDQRNTGTKDGCSQGDCWACTVLIDGVPTRACLTKVSRCGGKSIETIDGLAKSGVLHPIQQAFLDHGAVQCGFCTPGMVMHAKALLDRNPNPKVEEIKEVMGDHLCRCTGYAAIIRAVQAAAAVLRGDRAPRADAFTGVTFGKTVVGAPVPDKDGAERVTGQLKFADDIYFEGMLWGKILFASEPHAEILSIDTSRAEAAPGVRAVLTAKDVPGPNLCQLDRPVLCDKKVMAVGDMIAVVFADTLAEATQAVRKIAVEYKALEVISSPQRALQDDAPLLHPGGNVRKHLTIEKGSIAKAFAAADVVVEGHYETQSVAHAYLEPEAGIARPTDDGSVEIYYPTQDPFRNRGMIAKALALPEEKVRMISTPIGGGFGGKSSITVEILLGLGVLHTGRPVKITLTRAESLRHAAKRHPYYVDCKIGARKDGKFLAMQVEAISDAGAYSRIGDAVLEQSLIFAGSVYRWPSAYVHGRAVYTNNPPGTAFVGFGTPQVHFAVESTVDEVARRLGMDPIELRMKNALQKGSLTITGERLRSDPAVRAVLRALREGLKELPPVEGPRRIGVGIAAGCKNTGFGVGFANTAGAIVELLANGDVVVRASAVDSGQGTRTVLAQIAAAESGVSYDRIKVVTGDTALIPEGGGGTGQRQTYVTGNAVLLAARDFRGVVQTYLARQYDIAPEGIEIEGDRIVAQAGGKQVLLTLSELGRLTVSEGEQLRAEARYNALPTYPIKGDPHPVYAQSGVSYECDPAEYRNYFAYTRLAQAAIVEVDEDTGEVKLRRIVSCHEPGRVLNAQKVTGQIEGAVVMGMGYALTENFVVEKGIHRTTTLQKCGLPTMRQIPELVMRIVENPDQGGPFGAKGCSEVAMVPTAAAIANAICDAVGVRITSLPLSKDKVISRIRAKATISE